MERESLVVTLPSGRDIKVLESTGRDEKILGKFSDRKNQSVLEEYLSAVCTEVDGSKIPQNTFLEMLSGDRLALLIHNRILTHGSMVTYKMNCDCGNRSEHELDLQSILDSQKPYPLGQATDFEIQLGNDKLNVQIPTGQTEMKISRVQNPDFNTKLQALNITRALEDGSRIQVRLEDLKSKHISELRKAIKAHECFLDTQIKLKCPNCEQQQQMDAVVNADFLFPNSM